MATEIPPDRSGAISGALSESAKRTADDALSSCGAADHPLDRRLGPVATRGAASGEIDALHIDADQIDAVSREAAAVAEHNSLLALEATIDAARASGAGGFAMVAGDVKALAAQMTLAIKKLEDQLNLRRPSLGA